MSHQKQTTNPHSKVTIEPVSSGSHGNLYYVEIEKDALLLEAGISFSNIQSSLGNRMLAVEGVLVTHEHLDHAIAVKDLLKLGFPVLATRGTIDALSLNHSLNSLVHYITPGITTQTKNFYIHPFSVIHDAKEPVGFLIQHKKTGIRIVFITDTAYAKFKIDDIDYLLIECNYLSTSLDERVKKGEMNSSLRNRVVQNHMSLEDTLSFLKMNNYENIKRIYLIHLSDGNSDEQLMKKEVQRLTGTEVIVC